MADYLPVSHLMSVFFILSFNCPRMWAISTAKWSLPAGPAVTSSRTCWKTTAPQTTRTAKSPMWAQHQIREIHEGLRCGIIHGSPAAIFCLLVLHVFRRWLYWPGRNRVQDRAGPGLRNRRWKKVSCPAFFYTACQKSMSASHPAPL